MWSERKRRCCCTVEVEAIHASWRSARGGHRRRVSEIWFCVQSRSPIDAEVADESAEPALIFGDHRRRAVLVPAVATDPGGSPTCRASRRSNIDTVIPYEVRL